MHPNLPRNHKIRQEHWVLPAIRMRLPALEQYFAGADCQIPGGCSRRRHDLLYLFPAFAFAIELDEHGDRHEDCRKRLQELRDDHGHQASLVLRINPNNKGRPMMKPIRYRDADKVAGTSAVRGWSATKHFDECMTKVCHYITENVLSHVGAFPPRCLAGTDGLTVDKMFF
jgi:hypothetical protein